MSFYELELMQGMDYDQRNLPNEPEKKRMRTKRELVAPQYQNLVQFNTGLEVPLNTYNFCSQTNQTNEIDPSSVYYETAPSYTFLDNYGFDTGLSSFSTNTSAPVTIQTKPTSKNKATCSNSPTAAAIEKNRMMSINKAFELLRVHIPTFPYERRLSKIDTLHLTISYISLLQAILDSNMNLFDFLNSVLASSNEVKPAWVSSDLIVRLNWLNWSGIGIGENDIKKILFLFNELNRDK